MATPRTNVRQVPFSTLKNLQYFAGDEQMTAMLTMPDDKLVGALDWVQRHDRSSKSERFEFLDEHGEAVLPQTQSSWGKLYFTWLNTFRENIEYVLACRSVTQVLTSPVPTPDTSARRVVSFDVYSTAVRIGRSERYLEEDLALLTQAQLVHLHRWCDAVDKQGDQELVMIDSEGTQQPLTVQKLYGWRFFTYLNAIRKAAQFAIAINVMKQ